MILYVVLCSVMQRYAMLCASLVLFVCVLSYNSLYWVVWSGAAHECTVYVSIFPDYLALLRCFTASQDSLCYVGLCCVVIAKYRRIYRCLRNS